VTDLGFSFTWAVDDEAWEKARRVVTRHEPVSQYDLSLSAVEELLVGTVRFSQHGRVALPVPAPLPQRAAAGLWREDGPPGAGAPVRTRLFQGFDLPVAELACQLAVALDRDGFEAASADSSADYHMTLDALCIRFYKANDAIQILSNAPPDRGWTLVIPASELFPGVRRFLSEVAHAVRDQVPALTAWWTFEPLRPYLGSRPVTAASDDTQ
jgi:hypothetical protein